MLIIQAVGCDRGHGQDETIRALHIAKVEGTLKMGSLSSFARLPIELQVMILRVALVPDPAEYLTYLSDGEPAHVPLETKREQLKHTRLISHAFHDAVTPAVFASIHLHASSLSIKRAENIAGSQLAGHVIEIVHHCGSFADRNTDQKLFFSTLASGRRRGDYPARLKKADKDILYQNHLAECDAARHFPGKVSLDLQRDSFLRLVEKLPNLRTYLTLPYHNEWHDPETSAYTLKRMGLPYLPQCNGKDSILHVFMTSMMEFAPYALNLSLFPNEALEWLIAPTESEGREGAIRSRSGLRFGVKSTVDKQLDRLTWLKIGPTYNAKYGWIATLDTELPIMLRAALNLRHLELTNDYSMGREFIVLPKDGLPNLDSLTISKGNSMGIWSEKGLEQCIVNVGRSLKHVHLDSIELREWFDNEGEIMLDWRRDLENTWRASLIRLLIRITPKTLLRSCTGLETVRDVKWDDSSHEAIVNAQPMTTRKAMLLENLEQAVCHRKQWPLGMADLNPHMVGLERPAQESVGMEARIMSFVWHPWAHTVDEFESGQENDKNART